MILWLAFSTFLCAVVPCVLFCINLRAYREPSLPSIDLPPISILIPARNEAAGIAQAVRAALASTGCDCEVIVMDDSSTDNTAEIVARISLEDPRVRLEYAPLLPPGWNGKQHACWMLASVARHPILCFVDADVRLEPPCVARMAGFLEEGGNGLVSGFPQQITESWMEWMLLPLIHFVLLGFLPLGRMRAGTDPACAAGCGQFLMAQAEDYFACGGHSGVKLTMHDGLRLPRLFRQHGFRTDLADLTSLARCRMYTSASQVWSGLAKNATEGLASPARIVPVTVMLLLGQVVSFGMTCWLLVDLMMLLMKTRAWPMLVVSLHGGFIWSVTPLMLLMLLGLPFATALLAWLPRWLAVSRFEQDWRGALLHPLGVLLLLAIQWYALLRKLRGGKVSWRDRAYPEQ